MTDLTEILGISDAISELRADYTPPAPSYFQVWSRIMKGRLPAQKTAGRYLIRQEDVPAIAQAFGLKPRAPTPEGGD